MSKILELAKRIASTGGLETKTTETISGTYDSTGQQRLLSHAYTIGANLTITNGELILSRLADNGTGMTVEFGSDVTLSGDGTLMLGDLGQGQPNQDFSASRITGKLPSTLFPAGHVLQVKYGNMGAVATGSTEVYLPGSLQFDNAILSTSDVWMTASGAGAIRAASNDVNIDCYFSSADGGSLGEGASGFRFVQDYQAYTGHAHNHGSFTGTYLVTDPGSTTPTFKIYIDRAGDYEIHFIHMTMMEIAG